VLLQLQQVPAARQSTEVAMKYEKQPPAIKLLEAVHPSVDVWERKWNRAAPYLGARGILQHGTRSRMLARR
jgi:hypothetical protein